MLLKISIAPEDANADIKILVNRVTKASEGKEVGDKIIMTSKKYLDMDVKYLGHVFEDKTIPYAVSQQLPFYQYDNKCHASMSIYNIAKKIIDMEYDDDREVKGLGGFMESLLSFVSKK